MSKTNRKNVRRPASKKSAKKSAAAPAKTEGRIALKTICAELGLDPKASRVRLRRAWRKEGEENVAFHEKGARWDLTPAQAKEVRAILAD